MSWRISISADDDLPVFALWLRDREAIEVPPSPVVPGPLDVGDLPPSPGDPHEPGLGAEWLTWWLSLVGPTRQPAGPGDEPAYDTPDPLGLARLPVLRPHVARHRTRFLDWRIARHREHGTFATRRPEGTVNGDVVREVEAELGRSARPFHLAFTLLPVRDDEIRPVAATRYLVPERVYLGPAWPAWLRTTVTGLA